MDVPMVTREHVYHKLNASDGAHANYTHSFDVLAGLDQCSKSIVWLLVRVVIFFHHLLCCSRHWRERRCSLDDSVYPIADTVIL